MVRSLVLVSAGYRHLGACLTALVGAGLLAAVAACSREPADSPVAAESISSGERGETGAPLAPSASPSTSAPSHIVAMGEVKLSAVGLLGVEGGVLGERKGRTASAATAVVAARGPYVGTYVVLDAQAPRPLLAARTPLVLLVDEDAELAPGPHELTAYQERDGGLVAAHFGFTLKGGKVEDISPIPPRCVLALPRGTYRGADARAVRVVPIPSAGTAALRLALSPAFGAAGGAEVEAARGSARSGFELRGLPSGDYGLSLECLPGAGPSSESKRVITIEAAAEKGE